QPEDDRSTGVAQRTQYAHRAGRWKHEDSIAFVYASRGKVGHRLNLDSGDVARLRGARAVEHDTLLSELRKSDCKLNGCNGARRRHSVEQDIRRTLTTR